MPEKIALRRDQFSGPGPLGIELLIFASILAIAFWHHGHAALTLVAVAMDLQNVLHAPVAGADVGKGFITGALVGFGQSPREVLPRRGEGARGASNMMSWEVFVDGAMSGTLAIAGMALLASLALAARCSRRLRRAGRSIS